MYEALAVARPALGTACEQDVLEAAYRSLARVDFSKVLLERQPANLVMLAMSPRTRWRARWAP